MRPRRFEITLFTFGVLLLADLSAALAQTTIPLDPRATYLRTNEDPQALNAVPLSLDALGIRAGDSISLRVLGDFSYSIYGYPDDASFACGIFSANATLLPPDNLNRLPGAVGVREGPASPCDTWTTLFGGLPTDIPADFVLDGTTTKVPLGAHYLFVAVVDGFYGDNWDPDGDLAVQIQKAFAAIPLNIMWRVVPWEPDRMTTAGGDELQYTSEGQIFYVAADGQEPGTTTLYRHNNGPDHRDSTLTELPDYWMEGPLGFPWTSNSLPGLSPMVEGFNAETGDHALMQPGEQLAGYTTEPLDAFGYKRYYNQTESLLTLSAGGVSVQSNRVLGGALWRWTWNGKQFLSNQDSLRGSYSFMFINEMTDYIGENGDNCDNHAPLAAAFNNGTTQVTSAVPLANSFSHDPDNPCLHPFIWRDAVLGKRLTLDFNKMGPVAKYTTELTLPTRITEVGFYHPITSINPEFNRYWFYDAAGAYLQEVSIADACEDGQGFSPDFGGIILSTQEQNYAIGIYGASVLQGGSVSGFSLLRHVCDDGTYSRMDVIRDGDIPAGDTTYNVYMMTGTLEQVQQYMDRLHSMGAK